MTIEAEVMDYVRNAMSDDYDDGGFASFDATLLRVVSPESMRGEELRIYHDAPVPEDSPWRPSTRSVRFRVDDALLERGDTLFSGAVTGLEPVAGA